MNNQIIIMNGLAPTGLFAYAPGNGIRYMGDVSLREISTIPYTKNIIDNPSVEQALRKRYGFGDNLPEVQMIYDQEKKRYVRDLKAHIEKGDIVYSIVDPDDKKIHIGKNSGETLPDELKLRALKFVGN